MKIIFTVATLIGYSLYSCTPINYINSPSANNASFIKQKGELELTVSGAINSGLLKGNKYLNYGFDASGAYALSNYFFINGALMYRNEKNKPDNHFDTEKPEIIISETSFNHYMATIGGGYYKKLTQSGKLYVNLVAGVGYGQRKKGYDFSSNNTGGLEEHYDINLVKYHLYPYLNFFPNDYFRISFAPRLYLANYFNGKTNLTTGGYRDRLENTTMWFFEPSLLLQSAFKKDSRIRLNFGLNLATHPLGVRGTLQNRALEGYDSRTLLLTAGVSFYPFQAR